MKASAFSGLPSYGSGADPKILGVAMCATRAGTTGAGGAGGAVITGTWITGAGVIWGGTVVVDVGCTVGCEVLARGTVVVCVGCLPFEVPGCGVCGTLGSGGKFARVGDGARAVTVANGVGSWVDGPGVTGSLPGKCCRVCGVLVLGVGGCDNLEDREATACVALSMSCDTSAASESGSVA
jgi:hypothetical protein